MTLLLPIVLFLAWITIILAPAARLAVEDARAAVPETKRRGVSIFPGIPVMPLAMWGLAALLDMIIGPWGSICLLWLHVAALFVASSLITHDIFSLKRIT
ncbi:MAG: hypothetical protein V4773_13300 [Verrucomicrobiota bacterium]